MSYRISDDCVACQKCSKVCPAGAIRFDGDQFVIQQDKCVSCGACAKVCHIQAIHNSEEPKMSREVIAEGQNEFTCDFLVIGSGPAGLCSAVRMAEEGYHVIVLETLKVLGGAGFYATAMKAFGTGWEKEAGLPDRTWDYIRAAMNLTHWELDPKLVFQGMKAVPECFDWLCTWARPEEVFELQDTPFGTMVDMKRGKATAPYITEKYIERARELGVVFLTETRAMELVIEDNRIKKVIAEHRGRNLTFSCRACMIATGNMASSEEIGRFVPDYAKAAHNRNAHRMPSNTGDGVRMAEKAGVAIDREGVACHYLGAMPPFFDGDVLKQGMRCEGVRVNLRGERFVNECVDRFEAVTRLTAQPEALSYNIIDSNILEKEVLPTIKLRTDIAGNLSLGIPQEGKPLPMVDFMGFPVLLDESGKPLPSPLLDMGDQNTLVADQNMSVLERLQSYVSLKNRIVCVADTLEELAEQMGVPAQQLKATIARYNEFCEKGCDEDFAKYPDYMSPIANPPYIAIKCYLGSDGAFGGLFINENCQVMNDGVPVEGLYSGGDTTSGNYLKEHNRRLEMINDYTWANASGFIAGRHAAAMLKHKRNGRSLL